MKTAAALGVEPADMPGLYGGSRSENLLATTSCDGSIATTYKPTVTDTVCDSTRACALVEKGQELKVTHTANSRAQLGPARQALAMMPTLAQDSAAVTELCATDVSGRQWQQFLDQHAPRTDDAGKPLEGRARTLAEAKRDHLNQLYRNDPRVAPWLGTAHGVVQAVNTYEHHGGTIRGNRPERNGLKSINVDFDRLDRTNWQPSGQSWTAPPPWPHDHRPRATPTRGWRRAYGAFRRWLR